MGTPAGDERVGADALHVGGDALGQPAQIDRLDSIKDVERMLLEAANAIQRLIAERDALRHRVDALESELARLREQTTLIRDSHQRLATEFNTQLQLLDSGVNGLFREPTQSPGGRPAEQKTAEAPTSNSPPVAHHTP